ncbi:AraC family transcriptional regulator [Plantactinospora sp. B24E8]|uniref:AraC family transcriptional regulator n=1 Tax=Plantactinospora sp. B24E8 TaxID=3153567 RepID=UPI00325D32E2
MADRFGVWCERMSRLMAPMEMVSEHAADFRAQAQILRLGETEVWPTVLQPMHFRRTPRLVRQHAPDLYHVSLVLEGGLDLYQAGEHAVHRRHDLYIVDMARPFDCRLLGADRMAGIGIEIPKTLLPLSGDRVERLLGRRLSGKDGIGALLVGFLTQLASEAGRYRPTDGPRLGAVLVDLLSAVLAHTLDAERMLPPETRRRSLTLRIRAFIQRHLHEPQLTVGAVASAHHISVSYLHRLFEAEGATVAAWIREQRLERVRRDLADPAHAGTPIHELAQHWGFTCPAAFSRTFRSAYGMPPREFRRHCVG